MLVNSFDVKEDVIKNAKAHEMSFILCYNCCFILYCFIHISF
jgi:hypothetical protein